MTYKPPFYKQLFHSTRRLTAKYWLSAMPTLQIGITGSQGKTNTTRIISHALSSIAQTVVTDVNLDTIYNIPITTLRVLPWTKFAVFELGVDQPGEMDLHLEIVHPKIGLITGISPVHTDEEHLGSLENLIKEKRKLIEALPLSGYAILNYDDENVRKMASYTKAKVLWYGTDPKYCDIWVDQKSVKLLLDGTLFTMHFKPIHGSTSEDSSYTKASEDKVEKDGLDHHSFSEDGKTAEIKLKTKLIGKHHIYTVMAAVLTSLSAIELVDMNVSINQLIETIVNIEPLTGRMNVEPGPFGTTILNDALRANPSSTASGLQTLSEIKLKGGKKIAILAEMGELQHPEEEHRKIGQLLNKLEIDYVIGIGPQQKNVISEINSKQGFWAKDVYQAADALKKILKKGDLIYLKGSLYRHVERVLHIIEGKKPPEDLILEHY